MFVFDTGDTKRVVLYGGGGDYIHATFVDVSKTPSILSLIDHNMGRK